MVFWCILSLSAISSPTLHQVGRDVDLLALDADVAVQNELARLRARTGETRALDHVVQTALEHDDQVLAGRALGALGLLEVVAELPLEQP